MPEREKLDIHERLKVLQIYEESYRTASRKEKGEILDQLEELTKLNRKTLIRRLKKRLRDGLQRMSRSLT